MAVFLKESAEHVNFVTIDFSQFKFYFTEKVNGTDFVKSAVPFSQLISQKKV